ncbi:MAG: metallophosphoesterase family protein [Verrucomicrobia bacterium]|nr:metallophosphoesterase family protein [Verrucomicrobiota bacterium]
MRIAVLSDIHGNLEAFEAVMADISKQQCDRIICLGDVVGYGPDPGECIRILADARIPCIKGNHDQACSSDEFPYRMNSIAQAAILWTQESLTRAEKLWLSNLPYTIEQDQITFVHATPYAPDEWDYVTALWEAENAFDNFRGNICFIGHTHEPVAWTQEGQNIEAEKFDRLHIEHGKRYLINVGSVGQPRDRDPLSAYVLYDSDKGYFDLKRIAYDMAKTQEKILAAGLPMPLAQRLEIGR